MIPKKIGFYWSKTKMSFLRYMTLYSFRKWNSDWPITLYLDKKSPKNLGWLTPEEQDLTNYKGVDYLEKIKDLNINVVEWEAPFSLNPAHACDFCEWETLATKGGFFADMDILFIRNMNQFYTEYSTYDALVCKVGLNLAIGFLGAKPNSDLYTTVYTEAKKSLKTPPIGYQMLGTDLLRHICTTSDRNVTRTRRGLVVEKSDLVDFYLEKFSDTSLMNKLCFYPWNFKEMENVFDVNISRLPALTTGVHWYGGTQIAQKFNNLLTKDSFQKYDITICNLIKKVLNA